MARHTSLMTRPAPVFLEIAGIRIGFEFAGPGFKALAARRYKNFSSPGRPRYTFSVNTAAGSQAPFRPKISETGGVLRLKRGDFDCVLDLKTGLGVLKSAPRIQTFDSFLRTFYSWALLREGGMLLHCAGLVKNGKAYLFPGKSGAGKSTLSKLAAFVPHPSRHPFREIRHRGHRTAVSPTLIPHPSPGAEVVSDELNLVRFEKGRFRVYGSPFWGEMRNEGRQGAWPLAKVFILKKAKRNKVSAAVPGEALRLLLRCLMNFSKSPETSAAALNNAAALLAGVEFLRLEFTKRDAGFLNLI